MDFHQFTFENKSLLLNPFCMTLEIKMAFHDFKDTLKKVHCLTLETVHHLSFELTEVSLLTGKASESDNLFKTENRVFRHAASNLPIPPRRRPPCLSQEAPGKWPFLLSQLSPTLLLLELRKPRCPGVF